MAIVAAAAVFLAAACGGSGSIEAGDRIFDAPPWRGDERFVYAVFDRQLEDTGDEPRCELLTRPEIRPGETQLEEHCAGEYRDDSIVVVRSSDLAPIRSERRITTEKTVTHTVEYAATVATFRTDDGESSRETTRDLPGATEEHPDPGWYDDKSLFWLARGLPLAEGYEARYVHVINVGAPRVLGVDVNVEGLERVETRAGTFDAWKVRFERDNTVYFLWVATEAPRPVVQARIEGVTYELIEAEAPAR